MIENAIRHGIGRSAAPGYVRIRASRANGRLAVEVRNSLPDDATADPGTGIGLASVRERLRALYRDDHRVEITSRKDFSVTLDVPFVTASRSEVRESSVPPEDLTDRRAS